MPRRALGSLGYHSAFKKSELQPAHCFRVDVRASRPPLGASAVEIVQQRVLARSGHVGVVVEVTTARRTAAGTESKRSALPQVVPRSLVKR